VIVEFIDEHKSEFGVEPICRDLQIAPSTYYAHRARPPSARSVTDAVTTAVIKDVHAANYGVYGVRKVHAEVNRKGHRVARCTVARMMQAAGLRGISRAKGPRTTVPGTGPETRPDLVDRQFTASGPNQLWVAGTSQPQGAGRCPHLLPHVRRVGLRRVRHRRVLPAGGRLAVVHLAADRSCAGRVGDGHLDPPA